MSEAPDVDKQTPANGAAKKAPPHPGRAHSAGEEAQPATPPEPAAEPEKAAKPGKRPRTPSARIPGEASDPSSFADVDLANSGLYLNRELTWLNFNWRVLHEAEDERTPLLERLKFLAITSSNIDEFFMKRIGGLKQQVGAGMGELTIDGRTPREQVAECYEQVRAFEQRQQVLLGKLRSALTEHGIRLCAFTELSAAQKDELRDFYYANIFPLVTPQAMDPAHPFPFVSNQSLNLLVTLHHPRDPAALLARVKVPVGSGIPRFLQVGNEHVFVPLEEVMAHNLDLLFPGMRIDSCEVFRVTRNANTEHDEEEADDLMQMIEAELRERKFAPIVRLEVVQGMSTFHRGKLAAELGLDEEADVFEVEGMVALRDLMQLAGLEYAELKNVPHHPINDPELVADTNIFHVIRQKGSILLHHPYESFGTSVERFLREASKDPKVRAIKMTLYRTSADSAVLKSLIDAARNGKQVAVALELKARFDEEANIRWANQLEQFGIHVTYGVVGLKTHCKVCLVVRRDYNGLRRYAHVGTGNYHPGTARLYSDLGMLTCDDQIGEDLTELFNYLTTGYKPRRNYRKLLVAPKALKESILEKIEREIEHVERGKKGFIQLKCNALEDVDVVRALYQAAAAGVKIDLIIRDTCRLRPGLPGLTESVRVLSIVGRFLEHARILYFHNNGDEEYYIGSADMMGRNLESRVEVLVPVVAPDLRAQLREILDVQLDDQRSAWEMQSDGSYIQRQPSKPRRDKSSQTYFIEATEKAHKEATRLRKRKPKTAARRRWSS